MEMSTLPIRAPHLSLACPKSGLARVIAFVSTAIDVFAQAQVLARAAHNRYPFAEW
jgi:hypothetical protein